MDTDSLVYHIKTKDFYEDIASDVELRFDTSGQDKGGGERSEVGGRIGLGRDRTDEVEVENGR